jgi:hypothetical protein
VCDEFNNSVSNASISDFSIEYTRIQKFVRIIGSNVASGSPLVTYRSNDNQHENCELSGDKNDTIICQV